MKYIIGLYLSLKSNCYGETDYVAHHIGGLMVLDVGPAELLWSAVMVNCYVNNSYMRVLVYTICLFFSLVAIHNTFVPRICTDVSREAYTYTVSYNFTAKLYLMGIVKNQSQLINPELLEVSKFKLFIYSELQCQYLTWNCHKYVVCSKIYLLLQCHYSHKWDESGLVNVLHSRKIPHNSPLRASYGVSFVSYYTPILNWELAIVVAEASGYYRVS